MNYFNQNYNQCMQPTIPVAPNNNGLQAQKVKGGSNDKLFNENEAFMLGNLFESLYVPYCGFSNYPVKPQNRRQALLLNLQIHEFAAHEANLYLDMHPNNQEMIKLFVKHNEEAKKAKEAFECEFGPLLVDDINAESCSWSWVEAPWPWERQ